MKMIFSLDFAVDEKALQDPDKVRAMSIAFNGALKSLSEHGDAIFTGLRTEEGDAA